ncbi:hypothetical protein BpJC7_19100 [Weizmannia acidilactici]|uniref:DUF488 domain-containing protein n=1 Tax=Weizmannia acidilactici TaxID=2607726 RepID=A0A5J4JJQ9_9BACI|nr:DUF488 family protein [Weizmannia acidilactici]GER66725.1 hypothetical protein BpJC4_11960 [Weizmannia acidilactici]GER70607.1 hypothetical protein BpJC7_19100 [Weizmannia acidilactici]GER73780.1 hypothetical protein BpPP18_18470 [Weizmannia acidilactici]
MYELKRIYEKPGDDGKRVLVDRIWPRGVSKEKAMLDDWMKTVAPTPALRKWFNHDPEKFAEFGAKYTEELDNLEDRTELDRLIEWGQAGNVTLLYAAEDGEHNHAVVLKKYLEQAEHRASE